MTEPRLCSCHGEPMYFNRDQRYKAGGFWKCAVRERARNTAAYQAVPAEERSRRNAAAYDRMMNDPVRGFLRRTNETKNYHRKRLALLQTAVTEGGRRAEVPSQE